jgi:hypothetical protein
MQNAVAQKFIYKIDNLAYFDNRVFYSPYNPAKMYFGDRLTALGGLGIKDEHRLYAGVTAMLPFGADFKEYKFQPMIYYRFQQKFSGKTEQKLNLHFGILPYREMEMTLPSFIRKGSAEYSMPNLQGVLAQYKLDFNEDYKLNFEYLFDWRKIKSETQRDFFGMILNGKMTAAKAMDFGFIVQWDRLGQNLGTIKNNCDNAVINIFAKYDMAILTENIFKTLYFQVGYVKSFNNDDININKRQCDAITFDVGIQWKIITLKNSFYVAPDNKGNLVGNLMPLYKDYKEMFISDQYYQAPLYNKTELAFELVKNSYFNLKAQFAMHCVPNYKLGWQQKITAQVKF